MAFRVCLLRLSLLVELCLYCLSRVIQLLLISCVFSNYDMFVFVLCCCFVVFVDCLIVCLCCELFFGFLVLCVLCVCWYNVCLCFFLGGGGVI